MSVSVAQATIVKLDIAFGEESTDAIYIDLLDSDTPVTVANFLNYVENGAGERRYDGTFFHRSATGFVVQGGGFLYDPSDASADANGFVRVVTDPPIVNEFDVSRSNLRGRLAMAKLASGPDSATSGWFFNLGDNSANLDSQNGGFTVFANVSGDGMQVVDAMAALSTTNLGGAFTVLPVTDAGPVDNTNLVQITRADVYVEPQVATISAPNIIPLDFGVLGLASVLEVKIPLSNIGIDPLTITAIGFIGSGAVNFSASNDCNTLAFAKRCTVTLTYAFAAPADTAGLMLEILSDDPNTPQLLLPVSVILSTDADDIPDGVEIAGPNGGDANEDGIADALQNNVASFPDINGQYVVLEVDPGLTLANVQARQNPSPGDTPAAATGALSFDHGFFSFSIEGVSAGMVATVTITLPEGATATTYFNFGRLPEDAVTDPEHWYQFAFDGTTGAQLTGNQVVLQLEDGGRGDHDQTIDGQIDSFGGPPAAISTIVRLDIAFGDLSTDEIYIELFETEAPIAVANFLSYIENDDGDRRFDGTFFHRNDDGFVIQGGGFKYERGNEFADANGFVSTVTDDPIINEFDLSRSNVRGTIAMAKIGNDPDSATSQWFFNLDDNSVNLDVQNGGFTVFANVFGDGMLVVDEMSEVNTINGGGAFTDLPILDNGPVDNTNLVHITRADQYVVPQSATISAPNILPLDFGVLDIDSVLEVEIPLSNIGRDTLTITAVGFVGLGAANFSASNDCVTLAFAGRCTVTLTYVFSALEETPGLMLEILSTDPNTPQLLLPVAAAVASDLDGIPDDIEMAAPNDGDANNDGIADVLQNHVASFLDINNQYVMLETNVGLTFREVRVTGNPSAGSLPTSQTGSLSFNHGFFSFILENVPVGGAATVILTLPEGLAVPTNYFKYGRSSQSANEDTWYLFDFNGLFGAQIINNQVVLRLVDGQTGDQDQTADGRIVDPGGPALLIVPDSSGGGGGCSVVNTEQVRVTYSVDLIMLLFGIVLIMVIRGCRASKFYPLH